MKKSFVFLTIIILFVFTVGCQKSSSNATTFVTSCYPVHIITLNLVDGVDGVNRGFVEDVETALNIDGRHTYLYAPKDGEDFVNVVKHLSHAGIVVLLLINKKQEKVLEAENIEFTKDWNKDGKDVEKAAEFIKKQSVYDGVIVNTSEYI